MIYGVGQAVWPAIIRNGSEYVLTQAYLNAPDVDATYTRKDLVHASRK